MEDFNKAFLSKLAWKMLNEVDRPWVKSLLTQYCKEVEPRNDDSMIWKGILSARDVVLSVAWFLVGDRRSIDIWKNPWIPWLDVQSTGCLQSKSWSYPETPGMCWGSTRTKDKKMGYGLAEWCLQQFNGPSTKN